MVNVKEKNKIDHGLMAFDTIMVELQRCMKKSMASGNWMKEWRQVLKALASYGK